ncbi:MAG: MG2 domain-containing protein [Methylococcaceae bacterium]
MNKFIPLLLLFFLIACSDDQTNHQPQTQKAFDLASIQKQYADVELTIVDISEQSYQNGAALAVTLSTPLNPKNNFQSFFEVSDKNKQTVTGSWIISNNGLVAYFPEIEPSTTYTIDVYKNLTSATRKPLKTSISKEIDTRKMPAQVSFASHGSILPVKLAKGLPVISVNINEVDVDFHRIKTDKMSHFISTWSNNSGRLNQSNYYLREYMAYTDLVYSGRFPINPPKNKRYTTHLDLNSIDKIKQPGIYLAIMKPAGTYEHQQQVSYFTISDLGLHARMYPDQMTIQVSSLATGESLSDVSLTLIDSKENVVSEIRSDINGQANFNSPSHKALLLLARNKNNIALLRLNSPALDLSEFKVTGRSYKPIEIFTYAPRDLYRPGETVTINALLRDADGQTITAPPLNAVIKRPDGQRIKFFTWYPKNNFESQGFYQTEYALPSNAATGQWTLELKTGNNKIHQYHFQVEAFLPERMELLLGDQSVQQNWANRTDTLNISVSGQYLYGAPASKNRLSSKVIVKSNRHPVNAQKEYFFGLADEKPPIEHYELDDIKLDDQGLATIKLASRWKDVKHSPFTIKVIASLFETGGRPVTRTIDYQLWPQTSLIGIRPQTKLDEIPANTPINFDVIKSNKDGLLQGESEVLATLIKERRDYYWEYSESEGWHYEFTAKNFTTFEQRINLNSKQPSKLSMPVDWGSYLLKIKDIQTGQTSSLRFHAGSGWRNKTDTSLARPDRIVMELDKKNYQVKDKVQLHLLPPYAGNGFVMVESSEKPLWFQRVSIPAEGLNLSIPVSKDWNRHDLYISAIIFRPGDAKEKITPNRALGIVHLPLDRKERHLSVDIKIPNKVIRPEKTLTTPVTISGFNPEKETYVTLAAVDVGVLNISDFKTPNPYQWFFQPRRYGVEQRDIYNKIIELTDGGLIKPRFGGDADKRAGGARPDSSVQIVSLFSGLVKTNINGVANVDLQLPNFNGRLRLMAVAFNEEQFGSAEAEITVAAPIIAEASLPRFLASGDQSTMTLDLRNQSGKTQALSLNLSASSPVKLNTSPFSLILKDKEKQVLHFPLTAEHAFGQSQISLTVENSASDNDESININRLWHLGVRPAYPAITQVQRKIIAPGKNTNIKPALENLLLASANSTLSLSTQPPINIAQHLKTLLRYPYGCLEQTISSTNPWLSIDQKTLQSLGLDKIKINNKVIDINSKPIQIEKGINLLAGMQRNNGSFGLWSSRDPEEHWLTVYAAEFLLDAQEKGQPVAEELINKTLLRLTQYLNNRGIMYGERYSQAPGHYSFAYKAYAAYVLSRVNRAPLGTLRTLFDHHRQDVKSALPLTHLGLALYKQGDKTRGIKAIKESLTKPRDTLIYLGDYGSRLRDISVMTYLLNKHPVPVDESKTLIYQLADELNTRQYLSTQERNALFRTGIQLISNNKSEWKGQLLLESTMLKLQQKETYTAQFTGPEIPKNIQFSSPIESKRPIYLQFGINAYPKTAPKMQMDSIKVERNYYDLEGNSIKPEQHQTGDVLLVHLNVHADKRIKDALLVDLIPAGFELENQNLANNLKTDSFKIRDESIEALQRYTHIKYQEYLDDRFVAAIDLHENQAEHLFYLIRAITSGTYTNPPPFIQDMYRPYIRAIGRQFNDVKVIAKE